MQAVMSIKLTPLQAAAAGGLAVALALGWSAMRQAGGTPFAAFTEGLMPGGLTPPLEPHLAQPDELQAAVFLAVRYPVSVADKITSVIRRGWAPQPDETDPLAGWFLAPPSEYSVLGGRQANSEWE